MTIENRNKLEYNAKKMGDGITLKKVALFIVIAMFVALVPTMGFTEDRNTVRLARTIYALAGDEEYSVKLALGTVVMNRVESAWFGKTLGEVLAEKHQFPAGTRYDAESLSAAHAVLSGVRTLLITHSHADHFALPQMGWYAPNFRKAARLEPLVIAGSEKTGEAYRAMYEAWNSRFTRDWLRFQVLRPFEPTELNNARVTLFPAQHGADGASVYRIERDGQSILYLHDTGLIYDEVWADLKRHAPVSLVSLDAVCGPNRASEGSGHMSFVQDAEIRERMLAEGVANDKTLFVSNHICIHCCTSNGAFIFHEDMENILRPLGLIPSYDGLSIDLSL